MYPTSHNFGYSDSVASTLGIDAAKEEENVLNLTQMMGELDPEIARRILRRHGGDVQKAATSILEGDRGGDESWPSELPPLTYDDGSLTVGPRTPPPSKPEQDTAVIDLTDEDKELKMALEASLEQTGTRFGPSDRPPDPNWAVVPSNQEVPSGVSQDDQSLSLAIQESLSSTYHDFDQGFEQLPLEQRVRTDSRPVALRPSLPAYAYAGLLFQGLYFVPQIRKTLASWRPSAYQAGVDLRPPSDGPEHIVWSLIEIFANMDLAVLSELDVDAVLAAVDIVAPSHATESPGDLTSQLYTKVARITDSVLHQASAGDSKDHSRLLHFRYGPSDAREDAYAFDRCVDTAVVRVDVQDGDQNKDLISCLSAQLSRTEPNTKQQVIFDPSDAVAFQLVRHEALPSYSGGVPPLRERFRYPKQLYLDRFMKERSELAEAKRTQQQEIHEEIQRLASRKAALTHFNNKNTLKDIRSSLHYYEHIANKDDAERKETVEATAMKLRKILTRIENELETIDSQVGKLKAQSATLFEGPEFRKHRYDLRVVLVHDGVFGRSHIYSYVQQDKTWWKTVDCSVAEVSEETVLEDSTGLHLGAGPYLLIYSRALPENEAERTLPWPEAIKHSVKYNNKMFLDALPAEVASQARFSSPPTSPYQSASEWDTPPNAPSSPRGEPMDVSN